MWLKIAATIAILSSILFYQVECVHNDRQSFSQTYDFSDHNLMVQEIWHAVDSRQVDVKEWNCLARNIYHEARGEPYKGKLAVALVTLNRVHSEDFPNSICEVVFEKKQFSWVGKKVSLKEKQAWEDSKKLARQVILNYNNIHDFTRGSTYYDRVNSCIKYKEKVIKIGHHTFCRKRGDPIYNMRFSI